MFCVKCGKEIQDMADECSSCGSVVGNIAMREEMVEKVETVHRAISFLKGVLALVTLYFVAVTILVFLAELTGLHGDKFTYAQLQSYGNSFWYKVHGYILYVLEIIGKPLDILFPKMNFTKIQLIIVSGILIALTGKFVGFGDNKKSDW